MIIVHLVFEHEWERAADRGRTEPASLSTDGFVHCSTPAQAADTVERHFPMTRGLLVAEIETRHIDAEVRWEDNADGRSRTSTGRSRRQPS